jgi:ATP-dependent Clp protease ATP-binding subunit ClpB
MNLNAFTLKSQELVQAAQQLAQVASHAQIDNDHFLSALLEVDSLQFVYDQCQINLPLVRQLADKNLLSKSKVEGGQLALSTESSRLLTSAQNFAKDMKDEFVAVEHILHALINSKSNAAQVLKDQGLTAKQVIKSINDLRQGKRVTSASAENTYQSLTKYARNLNQMAQEGKLDPVIGRDDEIRRILQILTRRTKNNPVLVGEPGTGKTAIAEGLAHRIIEGDVPDNLKDRQIFALDMGALVAGAKFKGEFEERLKSVVKEVVQSAGNIVLFIDEIHTLVGAGGGEGAMDAANILKPALARGELRTVGATTLDEYQKHIEKDKALERRFQRVMVEEPDTESAISILRGVKEKYEQHHKVLIKDEAVIAAVKLSERYITNRFLPDKAIDLMDEASAKLRMEINSKPEELDAIDRKIMQLEIEIEAIKREKDAQKLKNLNSELANIKENRSVIYGQWSAERGLIERIQQHKTEIENLRLAANRAEREGDYGKVAELRYGTIKNKQEQLKTAQADLANSQSTMVKEEVTQEDIADVVAKWTGIPVTKMIQSQRERLLHLETELKKRVVGQDRAIAAVSDAVRRSRSGLQDLNKPVGSFLFLGTTGVGKTELAKALAELLFDDEQAMTRIDMSEYQERHAVSRLVGAPPGYIGYEEGGQLTEALRRRPYTVILLDEIEKAHPDAFNILLQVLDEGRLTDNKGRVADFKNAIIIMTSNLGSELIENCFQQEENLDIAVENAQNEVLTLMRRSIRPEFINRIDDIVVFNPLSKVDIQDIVSLQIKSLAKRLSDQNLTIDATDEAVVLLTNKGFDPQYGARPVKRVIQTLVLNELAKKLLENEVDKQQIILLDAFDDELVFRNS